MRHEDEGHKQLQYSLTAPFAATSKYYQTVRGEACTHVKQASSAVPHLCWDFD